ncbi:MAG: flavin reductase family protein [bacterium]|nr:flavin reductase family protein [bacterium]
MITFFPDELSHRDRHQLVLGGVAPRPIAFVATADAIGNTNLSPFSFFNAFASKPPILAIGPAVAAKTGREKDTWLNLMETQECTVSAVTYSMIHQMNLASSDYPRGVDEFVKAGFTKRPSVEVAPPSVAESPYVMECRMIDHIELRRDIGGNGNMILLEAVCFHVSDSVMTDGRIDPRKMDLVARMGHSYYCRATDIFEATQPSHICIGMDALPARIRNSDVLSGNDLAQLAYLESIPEKRSDFAMPKNVVDSVSAHAAAKKLIQQGGVADAWQVLLHST